MSVELNHTIIPARDRWQSAKFLADILNLEAGPEWGHFVPVRTSNGVTLDFSKAAEVRPQHYAFLAAKLSSTRRSLASAPPVSATTPISAASCLARSTTSMAGAGSISTIRAATSSN